jgi:uncharacterized repeat protein (TIGR01451 family)
MKKVFAVSLLLLWSSSLSADISLTDRASLKRVVTNGTGTMRTTKLPPAELAAQRAATKAANLAKKDAKRKKRGGTTSHMASQALRADATGSVALIDASGLKYFINTNITFSTSSSASGAASEASYTGPIVASTSAGGTTTSTLNDSFDGYNTICVSLTGATGPCTTGNSAYTIYNKNGPAAIDTSVPATAACTGRQVAFPAQTIGPLSVSRKVFVPTNDSFIRWANTFTNTSGAAVTFTMVTANNLGSDSNTRIVSSSNGDNVAQTTDTWVSTFQNFSGNTSSDPRIGHVLQGAGAPTPVSVINFTDGDDNPYWTYSITLAPGQTKTILNFATGQGTKAAANAKAAALALLPDNADQCMSATEYNQIANFATSADLSIVKTSTPSGTVNAGQPFSYTLAVTNSGPGSASSVSVVDQLPPGLVFGSATGTGWSCNEVGGTVTCTMPTLAVGSANPITINFAAAPANAVVLSNTATVTSSDSDPAPGNNSSTVGLTVVPVADLSIAKTSAPASGNVNGGQAVAYTLQVNNAGPSTATSVSVSDPLPAGSTFVSATGTGWSCNQAAGTVTCTMASLPVGAANPITINITAPNTAGPLNNTATVSSAVADPTPGNNSSTSNLTVVASADLSITKTPSSATAYSGAQFSYTLAVTNGGATPAANVSVTDTLAAGTGFVSATGAGWTCNAVANVVTCTRPLLAVGAAPAITLRITPPATTSATTFSNTAAVSSVTPDPAPGNNSATVVVNLLPSAAIPTLSGWMLLLMAMALGVVAVIRRG